MMRSTIRLSSLLFASFTVSGCAKDIPVESTPPKTTAAMQAPVEGGHAHAEVALGKITLGEFEVDLAQGHGVVAAGKEGHLVIKLPYSDQGATIVRAWVGSEDRTSSYVGKGEYAAAHDAYDVHASAPDPLPENARWWIELDLPDGTKHLGSAEPLIE